MCTRAHLAQGTLYYSKAVFEGCGEGGWEAGGERGRDGGWDEDLKGIGVGGQERGWERVRELKSPLLLHSTHSTLSQK